MHGGAGEHDGDGRRASRRPRWPRWWPWVTAGYVAFGLASVVSAVATVALVVIAVEATGGLDRTEHRWWRALQHVQAVDDGETLWVFGNLDLVKQRRGGPSCEVERWIVLLRFAPDGSLLAVDATPAGGAPLVAGWSHVLGTGQGVVLANHDNAHWRWTDAGFVRFAPEAELLCGPFADERCEPPWRGVYARRLELGAFEWRGLRLERTTAPPGAAAGLLVTRGAQAQTVGVFPPKRPPSGPR